MMRPTIIRVADVYRIYTGQMVEWNKRNATEIKHIYQYRGESWDHLVI